ncbi:hypothetical protein [Cytophaga sp. FL35]|uniref:hypothetical protein n=1 Tax=Cytophaga sp. FL35 TaxID=1904456 RepID=UPI0016535A8D|nr:hypothetical protein [Cytophaga sp. FL35]MBC7000712.1 hypothetical protein [Cytophaga sp. FL35]
MVDHKVSISASVIKSVLMLMLIWVSSGCSQSEMAEAPIKTNNRIISFSGYDWVVRSSNDAKEGPGPNHFSDSERNVWIDGEGRLHLKITYEEGRWQCVGVALRQSFSFNKYVVYLSSRVDTLDLNTVAGIFIYNNDEEEIDIEFSRWSRNENQNAQYGIQPSAIEGNKVRFDLNLDTEKTVHFIDWKKDHINFGSYRGNLIKASELLYSWSYDGADIPPDSEERFKINL